MAHLMQCAQDAIRVMEANEERRKKFEEFVKRVEDGIEARRRLKQGGLTR